MEREKEEQALKEQYQKDNQENVEHEKMKLFTSLAAGNISMGGCLGVGKRAGYGLKRQGL